MDFVEFTQPEYLLCEIPIKDGSFNDKRQWVYHRPSLSLIEFVNMNLIELDLLNEGIEFQYLEEKFRAVFIQDNTEVTDFSNDEVIQGAWKFLINYFKWEDDNIDNEQKAIFN